MGAAAAIAACALGWLFHSGDRTHYNNCQNRMRCAAGGKKTPAQHRGHTFEFY